MEDQLPRTDDLLSRAKAESDQRTGKLRVYLGMAAGVGKTYAMLADAQDASALGQKMVIGYLEPHGRPETEAMAVGLEVIPPRIVNRKGALLRELDVEACLARNPEWLLVDELAHSNPEECRHSKRWQDIEELLAAGINVATTVNIQHIESLRDIVAQITGVFVQETVPDSFFERAQDVKVIDLTVDALQERLRAGKIYQSEKVEQALDGFFKKGNLLALRELALRHTADKVEVELLNIRPTGNSAFHTCERVMVCIAPNKFGRKLVRAAKRLASTLHAELFAVTISSPRQSNARPEIQAEIEEALRLAEELGGHTATLYGEDIVEELMRYARQESVTTIVMGKPIPKRWKEILFGSVVDSLVRASGSIDVFIITADEELGSPIRKIGQKEAWTWSGLAEAAGWIAAATLVGTLMGAQVKQSNVIMLYLAGVVAVSLRHGRQVTGLCSVLSVVAFNYFFVPPRHSFTVDDPRDLVTFAVMLAVSLLLSSTTSRIKDQSLATSERERNTATLFELSKMLAGSRSKVEMARFSVEKISRQLKADSQVYYKSSDGEYLTLGMTDGVTPFGEKELAVAKWVIDHGKPAGRDTDTLSGAEAMHLPLVGSSAAFGSLAVKPEGGFSIQQRHFLESIASLLATGLERSRYAKQSYRSSMRMERERLRGDLLSSASHDLRTPLSSISGAATVLKNRAGMTKEDQELAATIIEESDRMAKLVRNLLDMTRVQGEVNLNRDWHALDELVSSAVVRTESHFSRPVKVTEADPPILVKVDGLLVEQVLVNLLENAANYAGRETQVCIDLGRTNDMATVDVTDDGPGFADLDVSCLFQRDQRLSEAGNPIGGFGLGLAICKAALEAHGGSIALVPSPKGAHFRIEIPWEGA